jgi:hypothetical protein
MTDSAFYNQPGRAGVHVDEHGRIRAPEPPRSVGGLGESQLRERAVLAAERQAEALEAIARWPADIFPVLSGLLSALGPVLVQATEAIAKLATLVDTPIDRG